MRRLIQLIGLILLIEVSEWVLITLNAKRIPVAIFALIIMFLLLNFKVIKPDSVKGLSDILIKNMGLFFVPLGVRIIADIEVLEGILGSVLLIVIVTTIITQFTIALVTKFFFIMLYRKQRKEVST